MRRRRGPRDTSVARRRRTRRAPQVDTSLSPAERFCAWCEEPLRVDARRDSKTCSQPCRQALHRFRVPAAGVTARGSTARTLGYADPPYPGKARRYYGKPEVNHRELVARLCREFPDGWALSTSSEALREVLPLCPPHARVAAWVNGPRRGVAWRPRKSWEAVIVVGGRARRRKPCEDSRDSLVYGGRQRSHPNALTGMKPAPFWVWLFDLLGAASGDAFVELFPGSGAGARAWRLFSAGRK
jgi:hypothetical protein